MIATLLTTILVALGVATGNVSSNVYKSGNAFNHELKEHEKPQPKRALEEEEYLNTSTMYEAQNITAPSDYGARPLHMRKLYIGGANNPHYTTQYLNVYNSLYTHEKRTSQHTYFTCIQILEIDNYMASSLTNINVNIKYGIICSANIDYQDQLQVKQFNNGQITDYIDRTLTTFVTTESWITQLNSLEEDEELEDTARTTYAQWIATGSYILERTIDVTIPYLAPHSNVEIYIWNQIDAHQMNNTICIDLGDLHQQGIGTWTIRGTPITQDYNYEVIDVPNLMFTILTLPFAFYSTAFNLTIFPGSPYAINFGNVILTILAALILLYLIRKILK